MVGDIHSVFALNDLAFLVFTTNGRFELWAIDSKEATDATLVNMEDLKFTQSINHVCRIDDIFNLDRHDTLKSRESLSESQVITDSETGARIFHVAEMKNIFDDWLTKNGILATDSERENALSSHHRFAISAGNELFIINFTLNYNYSFHAIVIGMFM